MSQLFTLLACLSEDGSHHYCPNFDSPFPCNSFWNYLFPDGLLVMAGFLVLGLFLIVTVRCIMNFWKVTPPFPRSWWFYLVVLAASVLFTYFWYREFRFDSFT